MITTPARFGADKSFEPASATIAIVTFNRSGLLSGLLRSISEMSPKPGHVVIIDNASTDDTSAVVESFRAGLGAELVYRRLESNTGGSGGFSEGMRVAYELGSTWIWLMDDDVEVIPDGLSKMGAWAPRFKSIQGRRYDYDGSEFYWQYRLSIPFGIPIPFAPAGFDESGYREMNSGCFEGMFIHRDIVEQIGLPDPRFFIYWDDSVYGTNLYLSAPERSANGTWASVTSMPRVTRIATTSCETAVTCSTTSRNTGRIARCVSGSGRCSLSPRKSSALCSSSGRCAAPPTCSGEFGTAERSPAIVRGSRCPH